MVFSDHDHLKSVLTNFDGDSNSCVCGIAYFLLFNDNIMVSLHLALNFVRFCILNGESVGWLHVELVEHHCWLVASCSFLVFSGARLTGTLPFAIVSFERKVSCESRDCTHSTDSGFKGNATRNQW